MVSFADGVVIGLSRLATQTTVRSAMPWYQIPMYNFLLELVGEKKPRAKSPPSEMSVSLGKSGFVCVSWLSDRQSELRDMRMKAAVYTISIRPFLFVALGSRVKKMACGVDEEHAQLH